MKTLTDLGLNKLANFYLENLSHVLYDLDDTEERIEFFSKKVVGNTVQAYVFFDRNYVGNISNIRVIDKAGDVVAKDMKLYKRTTDKALYVAFKHEFTEV